MANKKISDLTELVATPANGDFLEVYDISEATAADKNKKVTFQNLISGFLTTSGNYTITGVLAFQPSSGSVPFSTTKTGKVTNLNADLLDGNHAAAFETAFSKNNAFNKNFGGSGAASTVARSDHNHSGVYATAGHNHSGTYEPAFGKNSAFNKSFGSSAGTVAEGNHTHANYLTTTGTAYDSDRLGGVLANGYLRSNTSDVFTGTTLTIGVGSHLLSKEDIRSEKDVIAFYS